MRTGACARLSALLLTAFLPIPALAQTEPRLTVALAPDPVPVGAPIDVTATVLVPTFMPRPPVWPDLQIADAVTRLPARATRPVTERIGRATWSGLARTWQIVPQRPADYALGPAAVTITYADPDTGAPVEATLPLPAIAFAATVPPGAEGIDPFLAAASLTLTAALEGLPATPKPGDAFTLTLTTTASGPPAILLPPLADRLATPPGLRAYPRQPTLTDGDPSIRTEAIAYVIEAPGAYALPGLSLDWWNTATSTAETATTDSFTVDVPSPPSWRARASGEASLRPILVVAAAILAIAALVLARAHRRRVPRAPTERSLYRALRRAIRSAPPQTIRRTLAAWTAAAGIPVPASAEPALLRLEQAAYGPCAPAPEGASRADLRRSVALARRTKRPPPSTDAALPRLNPDY